ncbi:hypothetical protein [Prosthecochloris sp. HL-130-GSB]|uniref:hypothetical protein n=1 Tax=Prosthecochloris sp. HL-130-GSB TaxID=1974213 RepID=UPI001E55D5DA|nr:hypothetical protein [Prosthecochloris sp. HL-130-GSB]
MLKLEHIRELWFHVTNRCNMACSHCLFASSPENTKSSKQRGFSSWQGKHGITAAGSSPSREANRWCTGTSQGSFAGCLT